MAIFSPETLDEGLGARKKIVGRPVFPAAFDPGLVPGMPHNFTRYRRESQNTGHSKRSGGDCPEKGHRQTGAPIL
jgi:hypothetical protein